MEECTWGHTDCANMGDKCLLCITESQNYAPPKERKQYGMNRRSQKKDGRMGSSFEFKNHETNQAILGAKSSMTLNSGATVLEKGDEQIRGIINIMEELKTRVGEKARGAKSFAVKREWLEKLDREARAEKLEFWYLKFQFNEGEDNTYVVVDQEIIMSMVKTMVEDRRKAALADSRIRVAEKQRDLAKAEEAKLLAEIELLKAERDALKRELGKDDFDTTKL